MAFNWDKLCKAQRDYPRPKFALDAVGKLLKKRPTDPYLLAWKASTLLRLDRRADEALSLLTSLCQQHPPITDPNLLPFIYSGILNASRQLDPNVSTLSTVGAEGLKAWKNAAKFLPNRKAKLKLWSDLFVVAMKEECWEDARLATVQANKEGVDPKYRRALYYSSILIHQLGGERKAEISKGTEEIDKGIQIQLTLAQRQMKDAYDHLPKSTDGFFQVATMSDLRFMAAIYGRQNRCAELLQLWANPPPAVKKIIDGASWDFVLLGIEVAHRQKEWQLVETLCYRLIDKIWQPGNPMAGDPSTVKVNLFNICTMCWTIWKSLLNATAGLYPDAEGKMKIEKLYSRVWNSLPPLDLRTYRAIGLTQLSLESYLGHPMLDTITRFYSTCFRNPSCFQDLHRFVALLSIEEHKTFQTTISEHAQNLGTMTKDNEEGASEEDIKQSIRVWHEAETTVLKFELLMIVSLSKKPDLVVLESFVENALRLWHLQLEVEATDGVYGSDAFLLAVEALIYLFETTSLPQYLYQAAVLTRHSLSLDRQQYGRDLALLSTRLHLRLGLGTVAFEHYSRVRVKEMLHDNVAWIPLSRISQSHPFGASGPRGFSADNELEKVISTLSRMENKIDDLLYADLQYFVYDKAFDLLELKRKLRTSLTKHFCIIERRRIARLAGAPVDTTLDLPLRNDEDISDNCHWDAVPGLKNIGPVGLKKTNLMLPITKLWVHNFRTLIDAVNGITFKEFPAGHAFPSCEPFTQMMESAVTGIEEPENGARFTGTEICLNEFYWKPMACILQAILPAEKLPAWSETRSLEEAFQHIFSQLEIDIGEFHPNLLHDDNADFNRAPTLTEDSLNEVYGRLEALRTLNRLLDFMRPISKARTHALHKDITVARCDLLHHYVTESYRLHKTRIQAIIDRLHKSGAAHIRALLRSSNTGVAINGVIADETLNRYSKEYVDSAIEALNGVLKVQLG
ncbi:hypothetical protein P171DRAFT_488923 [Karstenula rhodostoma CBS 690.94]|uniref:Uncharacterized protein n=1 Tax=Karstenula rhodostoma CBS 690.94 TaxID=1392251 RepID=A0A9P4PEA2_9PLEO|nr:hypothetical protein P171DRAFT_488923 [Karstenula rhodostoma CBS 690.94]